MSKSDIFGTVALLGAGALTGDYLYNGDNSIIGKFLKAAGFGAPKQPVHIPDVLDRPRYGEPSTSDFEVPIKTLRTPFPDLNPDASGRVLIPRSHPPKHMDEKVFKHGCSKTDLDKAAWQVAQLVFSDVAVYGPTTKYAVGDTQEIHDDILHILYSHNPPEILLKLARFHGVHGDEALNPASPIYAQERQLAGSGADLYENAMGIQKMFSREGFAYVGEYDEEDDRQAALGAESPITFNIGGGYFNQ